MILNGALPPFDLAEGGLWLALSRGLSVASLASAYGTPLFRSRLAGPSLKLMSPAAASRLDAKYRKTGIASIGAALFFLCLWLVVQSGALAGTHGLMPTLAQVPAVLGSTEFGHIVILQATALLAALALLLFRKTTSETFAFVAFMAGCAVVAQAWHGHAAAMYDGFSPLLLSEIAHLLAATAWLGSLVPLLMLVRAADAKPAFLAAHRFGSFGTACVVTLLVTALWQGSVLVGSIPALVGTAYGWLALVKLALFGILLGFAALNRFRLTPERDARKLVRSITLETGFGLAILLVASTLVMLPPGMHIQSVWPFGLQFSLLTLNEAPELRAEVEYAALALLAATGLIVAAIFMRRLRYPGLLLAAVIVWFAVPHLDLLLVEAYPTSFYHSTTGFSTRSIAAGAALYPANCARCHGPTGMGDGPDATDLPIPPADLTAGHLWGHSDGELFWWLTNGIDAPDGGKAMPPFAAMLSEEERWQLIDFIRARNAGDNHMQVQAPGFDIDCIGGATNLQGLHGQAVRLVFGADHTPPEKLDGQLVTVLADPHAVPDSAHCAARDISLAAAYANVSGVDAGDMDGRQFLIDPNGWLRSWQRPEENRDWNDPDKLLVSVHEIVDHPLAAMDMSHAHHHH